MVPVRCCEIHGGHGACGQHLTQPSRVTFTLIHGDYRFVPSLKWRRRSEDLVPQVENIQLVIS